MKVLRTANLHCYLYPVLVILVTTWTVVHLVTETSSSGSHIEEVLVRVTLVCDDDTM